MRVLILGAGEQGRVVLNILQYDKEFQIIGFIDVCDNKQIWGTQVKGIEVLGGLSLLPKFYKDKAEACIVAFGDNKRRVELAHQAKKIGFLLINAIHPSAVISKCVTLGEGIVISPNVTINPDANIGNNVIINTGAIIEHDCVIEEGVHIAPGVHLAGGVKVKEKAFVGIGATIIDNLTIGKNSIIGAGAVIIDDVPDDVTVVGVPGKIIKNRLV
jgi:sugar O-acyltransferase (sialic acid O-acetyltransferase NeuD family)